MSDDPNILYGETLGRLAEETGLAIAIVDGDSRQVAASNNNSICRHLNPSSEFSPACARFCGKAFEKTLKAGKMVGFECHAGLDCRAVAAGPADKPFVAIVGRTFLSSDNYRKATERAIKGDWSEFPPSKFFENVLLTGSPAALTKTAEKVEQILAGSQAEIQADAPEPSVLETGFLPDAADQNESGLQEANETASLQREPPEPTPEKPAKGRAEALAWRSFFGSILKTDFARASASILEFIAHQYGLSALVWLEKTDDRFETGPAFGEMKNRKVRLGILSDDKRLAEAFQNEMPLELGERDNETNAGSSRVMHLFPIGVGGEISAAIAVLDRIDSNETKRQIARICHSIAPQLEILRLRSQVSGREGISNAVKVFAESLKSIDADDFWQNITQSVAQIMLAERASLLILNEKSGELEIRAMVGAKDEPDDGRDIGSRVAKIVFAKNEAVVVPDVLRTSLPPTPRERKYKTASFLSSPINLGAKTIGVVNFTDRINNEPFDNASLEIFQAIAPQLAVAIDRATLKEKAGEFEQLSVTDALTGLLNRRYIEERLLEEVKRSNRHGFPMSFMMLDVDHFKSYNDQFGHPAGDAALKLVAHVIRDTLRGADVAARFGGEEFSILLPQTTAEEAVMIAERIRSNIEHANFAHRLVTTSIGVASCSAELCVSTDLVSAADKALYEAKRQGRNRVHSHKEKNGKRPADHT
jgi:diguanylate cyclase (GGDEF)-like protein